MAQDEIIEDREQPLTGSGEEDFAHLLDEHSHLTPPADGELLRGLVVAVHAQDVIVDVGYKLEGMVPIEQFRNPDGSITVQRGDTIDVMADRSGPPPEGYILLSYRNAARLRVWDTLEAAARDRSNIVGRVTEVTKGGLMLDVGVPAFLPGSQVDSRPVHNLEQFAGQEITVRVVTVNRRRGNVVVSRKIVLDEERRARKAEVLERIQEGGLVTGVVKNLTDYGAFVDLGGIDGLLHVGDMSHGRITHPSQVVHVGQEITAKVLKFDPAKERISLGLRQLSPDPWESLAERYPKGSRIVGRVMSVTDYGAFVEIEPGVEGLIHVSEMTWSRRMKHPTKVVKPGDTVEAVVIEVKSKDRRVSLGIKQLQPDSWESFFRAHEVGDLVRGRVIRASAFGVFVELAPGVEALCHRSEIPPMPDGGDGDSPLPLGEEYDFKIVKMSEADRKIGLSLRAVAADEERTRLEDYQRQAAAATMTMEEAMNRRNKGDSR